MCAPPWPPDSRAPWRHSRARGDRIGEIDVLLGGIVEAHAHRAIAELEHRAEGPVLHPELPVVLCHVATGRMVRSLPTPGGKIKTGTCDLGTLDGQGRSEALGVNDRDQVVGLSPSSGHAFLWQDGRMLDLNELVVPGTRLILTNAQDINDRGEITGQATDPDTGATVAFEAIPVN